MVNISLVLQMSVPLASVISTAQVGCDAKMRLPKPAPWNPTTHDAPLKSRMTSSVLSEPKYGTTSRPVPFLSVSSSSAFELLVNWRYRAPSRVMSTTYRLLAAWRARSREASSRMAAALAGQSTGRTTTAPPCPRGPGYACTSQRSYWRAPWFSGLEGQVELASHILWSSLCHTTVSERHLALPLSMRTGMSAVSGFSSLAW
mmetsp:Transcript_71293/g.202173  ORF Transcript_71293/g.202173 Transcript_71293/m.202173 type:complete len:202 (+) Transcript_71293:483-1088(+)